MRILHTSDLHLSSPIDTHLPPTKAKKRRAEITESFFRLADAAKAEGARAIIIAGDLFDSQRPAGRARDAFLDTVRLFSDIDFLYLCGNHEKGALENSSGELPRNLKMFGDEWTYFDYDGITVAGRRGTGARIFDTLSLDPRRVNIAVLHGAVGGEEERIPLREAGDRGIDYLALGHYHSYAKKEIDRRGIAVYSGTPEGRGFDECGEKGYVMLNVGERGISHAFIPHAKRRMHSVSADLSGMRARGEILATISTALDDIPSCDIVRLTLSGEGGGANLPSSEEIVERYANNYFHFEVDDRTRDVFSISDYQTDKSLKGEFVRLVSGASDISEADKELILRAGLFALLGEECEL